MVKIDLWIQIILTWLNSQWIKSKASYKKTLIEYLNICILNIYANDPSFVITKSKWDENE